MLKSKYYATAFAITTFGIGVIIGFLLPRSADPSPEHAVRVDSGDQVSDEPIDNEENLDDKIHVIEKTVSVPREIEEADLIHDRVRILQQFSDSVRFPSFSRDLEIAPACRKILGMSDAEVLQVEHLLARSKEKVDQYLAAELRLIEEGDNHTVFELPASEWGKQAYDEFDQSIQSILGSERGEVFLKQADMKNNDSFSNFGRTKIELTITYLDDNTLQIHEQFFREDGTPRRVSMTSTGQRLPEKYRSVLEVTKPETHTSEVQP